MLLGAGRARMDSRIDPAVGVILHTKVGDHVAAGDPLCTILVNDSAELPRATALLESAYVLGDEPIAALDLIVERL